MKKKLFEWQKSNTQITKWQIKIKYDDIWNTKQCRYLLCMKKKTFYWTLFFHSFVYFWCHLSPLIRFTIFKTLHFHKCKYKIGYARIFVLIPLLYSHSRFYVFFSCQSGEKKCHIHNATLPHSHSGTRRTPTYSYFTCMCRQHSKQIHWQKINKLFFQLLTDFGKQ